MTIERINKLWSILHASRSSGRLKLVKVAKMAHEQGLALNAAEVSAFIETLLDPAGICPTPISEFISSYISDFMARSILDPWAGLGTLLIPLAQSTHADTVCGISSNTHQVELAKTIAAGINVSWLYGDPLTELDKVAGSFDVIASCPPLSVEKTTLSLRDDDESVLHIHDDINHLVLLKSCLRLTNDGVGLFVVSPAFVASKHPKRVLASLGRFGLKLEAYISTPPGMFAPLTALSAALVIIRRGRPTNIFVAELGDNSERNAVILKNLKARIVGREVALGRLVDIDAFRGYPALIAEVRLEQLARRLGFEAMPLTDVATEINLTKASDMPGFEDRSNAVYLPLIGRSNAVALLSELTLKPHNYAQIVIDPKVADAQYIAGFFNTKVGLAIRNAACSGIWISKITKNSLSGMRLFLPDRDTQLTTIENSSRIDDLINELRELRHRLWNQPRQIDETLNSVKLVNREDRFTEWLETLPFPLASILWTYHASGEDHRQRYAHLLSFFEALAEFMATILLSGFSSDQDLFKAERSALGEILAKSSLSIERSSFGTWVRIMERLAKKGRTMLNEGVEELVSCQNLFRTSDRAIFDLLFSGKLVGLLQQTNMLRNNWKGHGGVVSDKTAYERHVILQNHLIKMREYIANAWEAYQLVLPRSGKFVSGSYTYSVARIMGSRTPFESMELSLGEPLEDGYLHILSPEEPRALKLLPLVKVMPSPATEQNACYFYNRWQAGDIRFISYHFDVEAEIVAPFDDTAAALRLIMPEEVHRSDARL
ncbi:class I SAM-dependent methyltransferase [Chloroflexota bacterium]